jgi:hypothetical protein
MAPSQIASLVLVGACALWAFSFPLLKSLVQLGQVNAPGSSTFFLSALLVALRFTVAAAFFLLLIGLREFLAAKDSKADATHASPWRRWIPRFSALELRQGFGIGLFGGLGLVLQMDGLAYTHGSVSAFLTQGYAVLIPVWVALTHRRAPGWTVTGACVLVGVGAAILAGVSPDHLQLGRGEWETLAGSVLFAAQILWLERPVFAKNRSLHATTVMFATMAATCWPLAVGLSDRPESLVRAYASPQALLLFGILTAVCTLTTFPLANHWQPKVSATQAGLLYCTEPVFTSLVCLFVPGWISGWTSITYPDETLTASLVLGGSCILGANIWLQLVPVQDPRTVRVEPPSTR